MLQTKGNSGERSERALKWGEAAAVIVKRERLPLFGGHFGAFCHDSLFPRYQLHAIFLDALRGFASSLLLLLHQSSHTFAIDTTYYN